MYFSFMFLIVVLESMMVCCSISFELSFSRRYMILNSVPKRLSGLPSPFSSMTSRSSDSYHVYAWGIRIDSESFSFLSIAFTFSVAWISVFSLLKFRSPIFWVFIFEYGE